MKKTYMMLVATILMLSIVGTVVGNAQQESTKVMVKQEILGTNKTYNKQIVNVTITTNNPGHIVYTEQYYAINSTGNPVFVAEKKLYETDLKNDTLKLRVIRPMNKIGKQYLVKGIIDLDNKSYMIWLKLNKTVNTNLPRNANFSASSSGSPESNKKNDENKKAPGFEIVSLIAIVSAIYLLMRRKNR